MTRDLGRVALLRDRRMGSRLPGGDTNWESRHLGGDTNWESRLPGGDNWDNAVWMVGLLGKSNFGIVCGTGFCYTLFRFGEAALSPLRQQT